MEGVSRRPFQGITNIMRFNWHFYVLAGVAITGLLVGNYYLPAYLKTLTLLFILLASAGIFISMSVSYYVYDRSNLYSLDWLNDLGIAQAKQLVNINAGFDETSESLQQKYPDAELTVFDFYDPAKHTEVSIERARKAYPAYSGTKIISTNDIPLQPGSADCIFLILAAHEIRNDKERTLFFQQLRNALTANGKIIVVEHLRDMYNFMAYNIGFFHFLSKNNWERTFTSAELSKKKEIKITPFISVFILQKNGSTT